MFSRFGLIEEAYTDGGPQFSSFEFSEFAREFNFKHTTSSPHFPSSNGMAERAVQTVKSILKKDQLSGQSSAYMALLNYRATPLKNGYSPAELMMGRKLKTNVPILSQNLLPKAVDMDKLHRFEEEYRSKYKENADKHTGAREAHPIVPGDKVLLKEGGEGIVLNEHSAPRSHIIQKDDGGSVRRNRRHFVRIFPQDAHSRDSSTSKDLSHQASCPPSQPSQPQPPAPPTPRVSNRKNKGKKPSKYKDYDMS